VSQPWFWKRARSGWIAIVARRRLVGGLRTDTVAIAVPYHGGLTPAALGRLCGRRRTVGDFHRTTFASHATAG
jgi:hypothetical protein